jgi:2-succinyl-5-enolpyruvyl-6-hydroxy-3-cyclohexene-1-carboxylate synthase
VRLFTEVGAATLEDGTPSANSYWRSLVCRAVASSADGPVHLNAAFREPLEFTPADDTDTRYPGRADGRPWIEIDPTAPESLANNLFRVPAAARGVVVVGDDAEDPAAAAALAEAMGWPLLAEPQSNARRGTNAITTYRYLLGHAQTRQRLAPEIVISVGRPGISREVQALLREAPEVIVVDPHDDWADPTRSAHRLMRRLPTPSWPAADPSWLREWQDADSVGRDAIDGFLEDSALSEPQVIRDTLRHLPDNALCVFGSSMPIRDAEVTMPPRRSVRMMCNRGLAGIDGTTSTAIGAAIAHQADGGGGVYAIMGDLTFLHDLSGLITGPTTMCGGTPDLTIVVINNQGGGIFSLVGHTADAVGFDDLFGAPHAVDIAALAAGAGWQHHIVSSPAELVSSLTGSGLRIVEVRTDRNVNAKLHQRLADHVAHALDLR